MAKPVRILYVDDSVLDRELVRAAFEEETGRFSVTEASSWSEFNACLTKGPYDLVLTDFNIRGVEGIQVLDQVKAKLPGVPVIIITGTGSEQVAAETMKRGAADYVIKSTRHIRRLPLAIDAVLTRCRLQEQERKALESLRESNIRLEKALEEVRQMQKQLIRKERLHALGQMASGIVHDFNNSLMCIIGSCECVLSNPKMLDKKDDVINLFKLIMSSANDAEKIVQRLQQLHTREDIAFAPTDIEKIVKDAVGMTQHKWKKEAEASGRKITVEISMPNMPSVMADESQLREVLINLIINAVDAMPSGGTIKIQGEQDGSFAIIKVIDSGEGMTDEVRQRCLEAFFSTKGKKGTGMGLAMADGIILRHGGTLDIESERGKGTTFLIRLPVEQPPAGK